MSLVDNTRTNKNTKQNIEIELNNLILDNFEMKNSEYLVHNDYYENKSGMHEYRLYSYLSTFLNDTIILDIGTSYGRSAIALSHNENNKVLTYDIINHIQNNNHKVYSKSNIYFRVKDVLEDLNYELVNQCNLIVIDIDHYGRIEQQIINKLIELNFSGILILNDIHHPQQDMKEAMKMLWNNIKFPKFDITTYGHCSGTGLILMNTHYISIVFKNPFSYNNNLKNEKNELKTLNKKKCIHKYLTYRKDNKQPPGFADFLRGTIALFNYSKKYKYELFVDDEHPVFNYIDKNYIFVKNDIDEIHEILCCPMSYDDIDLKINTLFSKNESLCLMTHAFYTKNKSGIMENWGDIDYDCKQFMIKLLTPNKELNETIRFAYDYFNIKENDDYDVIHLRLGDIYLYNNNFDEATFNFVNEKIKIILSNKSRKYILFTDSISIGNKLKEQNKDLYYLASKKIHMGDLINNSENSIRDTLVDFFIMSKSNCIYSYAFNGISGFSKIISLIYDIKYIMI